MFGKRPFVFGKRCSCSDNEPDVADKACFVAGKAALSAGMPAPPLPKLLAALIRHASTASKPKSTPNLTVQQYA